MNILKNSMWTDEPIFSTHFYQNPEFEYVCRVGGGGYGTVYCLKKKKCFYALKVAKRFGDKIFIAEIEALKALNQPLIPHVYEYASMQSDELPWILMDFIPGISFSNFLTEGYAISDRNFVLSIGILAYTIMKMHQQGIIHTDINPNNVLIDPALRPHLIGFGFEISDKLITHIVCRSVSFSAPEVLLDDTKKISPKSDIFSLGAIIISFLTGEYPHYKFYTSLEGEEKYQKIIDSDPRFNDFKENLSKMFKDLQNFEPDEDEKTSLLNRILTEMVYLGFIDESYKKGTSFYNHCTPLKQACIDLAYKCMNPEPDQRPTAEELLNELYEIVQQKRSDIADDFETTINQIDSTKEIYGTPQNLSEAFQKGFQSQSKALEEICRKYFPDISSLDSYDKFDQVVESLSQ